MAIQPRNDPTSGASEHTRKMQRAASAVFYAVLVLVALYTARTFIPAVVWASVIAIALWPAFGWLERRPMFRRHHNLLAVVLTALLALVPFIPILRDIPRWVPGHRLSWRGYYRTRRA